MNDAREVETRQFEVTSSAVDVRTVTSGSAAD
jgi:hypothetical protein